MRFHKDIIYFIIFLGLTLVVYLFYKLEFLNEVMVQITLLIFQVASMLVFIYGFSENYKNYPFKIALANSFPIHRVREIVSFTQLLKQLEGETHRVSELFDLYRSAVGKSVDNMWIELVVGFMQTCQDETADAVLPGGWFPNPLWVPRYP